MEKKFSYIQQTPGNFFPVPHAFRTPDKLLFFLNHRLRRHVCNLSSLLALMNSNGPHLGHEEVQALIQKSLQQLDADIQSLSLHMRCDGNAA